MTAPPYLRIATEEAYAPPELFKRYRKLLDDGSHNDPGFASFMGFYLNNSGPRLTEIRAQIQDLGERRIRDMDATGIAKQILSLTSPGVQVFDAANCRPSGDLLQRSACRGDSQASRPLCGTRRDCSARSLRRRERTRASRKISALEGRDRQFPHPRRISRRAEILGDFRGRRIARRSDLSPSHYAFASNGRTVSRSRP